MITHVKCFNEVLKLDPRRSESWTCPISFRLKSCQTTGYVVIVSYSHPLTPPTRNSPAAPLCDVSEFMLYSGRFSLHSVYIFCLYWLFYWLFIYFCQIKPIGFLPYYYIWRPLSRTVRRWWEIAYLGGSGRKIENLKIFATDVHCSSLLFNMPLLWHFFIFARSRML